MPEKKVTFRNLAKTWANQNELHGAHAFLRYVMMTFVECLASTSDQFVFKGGNLLWLYIKTPRSTVDVDFSTKTLKDHARVKGLLDAACMKAPDGISFTVVSFKETTKVTELAAEVKISYQTEDGASNAFDLDIVYNLQSPAATLPSPIHDNLMLQVSTLENIIADKIAASHRFTGGNTRMKDFDDLWRISLSHININKARLNEHLIEQKVDPSLDSAWSNPETERSWQAHIKRYPDLPNTLIKTIQIVNEWLKKVFY